MDYAFVSAGSYETLCEATSMGITRAAAPPGEAPVPAHPACPSDGAARRHRLSAEERDEPDEAVTSHAAAPPAQGAAFRRSPPPLAKQLV